MSRICSFSDGMMEAAWLAAVTAVPLFFNKYSDNSYEPEKVFLLLSLALVIAASWLLKAIAGVRSARHSNARPSIRAFVRLPLAVLIGAYALILILSTALSIDPEISFWGSPVRGMGSYTLIACLFVFTSMAANPRTKQQAGRVVTAAILASIPGLVRSLIQQSADDLGQPGTDPYYGKGRINIGTAINR